MKFNTNNKLLNGEDTSDHNDYLQQTEHRPNAAELIDDILAEFMELDGRSSPSNVTENNATYSHQAAATATLLDVMTPAPGHPSNNASTDAIDPSSELGTCLRDKFTELEVISQRLKSRLGLVVDEHITLNPYLDADDASSLEAELEHDLDTNCSEDLSLQEFLQLLQSQN